MRLALLALLLACGKGPGDPPATGSNTVKPATQPATLRPLGSYPGATLIVGSRRIAIATEREWFDSAPGRLVAVPAIAAQIAKLRGELGGDFQVFLGAHPIVVGGEEHHAQHVRLTPEPVEIELEGHLVAVAAVRGGSELWQYEERLRGNLAVVDARGAVTPLPAHELLAEPVPGISPVGAKKCAAPQLVDLASTGEAIAALLVECNPDAPIRIATYRWPGPTSQLARFASTKQLGFEPSQLVVAPDGTRAIVGAGAGKLVIARAASDGRLVPRASLSNITIVVDAAIADDGAVWTLAIANGDDWQVARDGVLVGVADPSGKPLRPSRLAFDEHHGVVVLAGDWLLVER